MVTKKNSYTAQDARIQSLRPTAGLWRLAGGFLLILLVVFAMSFGISAGFSTFMPAGWIAEMAAGTSSSALLVLLFSFVSVPVGVFVAVKLLQKRTLADVIGPRGVFRQQFFTVLGYLAVLMGLLLILPPYALDKPLVQNLPVSRWVLLLPLSIAALLVQTGAEEILFRGYLQQSLAARFRTPAIFILVPSALFAIGHYVPAQTGDNAWIVAIWAGVFGVLMADLTARAGTLGPAIAIHFFNNLTAIVIVAPASAMNGLALYRFSFDLTDTAATRPWMAVDFALLLVCWLIGRLAIRR